MLRPRARPLMRRGPARSCPNSIPITGLCHRAAGQHRPKSRGHSSMSTNKLLVAAVLGAAIGAPTAAVVGDTKVAQNTTSTGVGVPFLHGFPSGQIGGQTELSSLERATEWLNAPPLTAPALRGKVVLIDFWTYTGINWLRTLPYVRAWAEKYKDQGLVVVGVHAPEFAFEKNINNVRWAVKEMQIDYAVAVDNEHAIWRAFRNNYWPALYFIDAQGRVRHHHFGEGSYEQSEKIIQELLAEAGAAGIARHPVSVDARAIEAPADWNSLQSGENYVGYDRTQTFASPGGPVPKKPHTYEAPARLRPNEWALAGDWTVRGDAALLNNPNGGDYLPLSRTRSSSCHGTNDPGNANTIPRAHRRKSAR